MSNLTEQQYFFPRTRVTETARMPLRLPAIVAGLLLSIMSLLTGCGVEGESGGQPITTAPPASATASLAWSPVTDSSVSAYFVHYGRQSPSQEGSCTYESSIIVDSSSAAVTNLDPNTLYYFSVSAYNGLESACSNEVSLLTAPPSVQTDQRNGAPSVQTDQRNGAPSVQTDQRNGAPSVQTDQRNGAPSI